MVVVDPAGKYFARLLSMKLIAKLEEPDEVGHGPFRVLAVGGEVGQPFLESADGGLDSG
jgi:hypothetical protein